MERFDLDRFVRAQDPVIAQVERELGAGRKESHWMWFVFPQLRGLGHSPTAKHYGIASLAEARAYLAHPILGPRLAACTALVNRIDGRSAKAIFGSPDDLKLRSSMTLFRAAAPSDIVFGAVLDKYFGGEDDPLTMKLVASEL